MAAEVIELRYHAERRCTTGVRPLRRASGWTRWQGRGRCSSPVHRVRRSTRLALLMPRPRQSNGTDIYWGMPPHPTPGDVPVVDEASVRVMDALRRLVRELSASARSTRGA